jgi:hypothetical protein
MTGDQQLRDLERSALAAPDDLDLAARLATGLLRAGRAEDAERWAVRALGHGPDPARLELARAARVPFLALPAHHGHALVAVGPRRAPDDVPRDVASLPFHETTVALSTRGVVAGFPALDSTELHVLALANGLAPWPGSPFQVPLAPPLDGHGFALALVGTTLYVGGLGALALRDLRDADARWVRVALPPQCARNTIDALLVDGARLLVVDDVVFPKYLLAYDVTDPLAPALLSCEDILSGTNQRIRAAALGERWLAVLTGGAHRGGDFVQVKLVERASLALRGWVTHVTRWSEERDRAPRRWHDVAVDGGRLLIAAGVEGVLSLDLSRHADPLLGGAEPEQLDPGLLERVVAVGAGERATRVTCAGPGRVVACLQSEDDVRHVRVP